MNTQNTKRETVDLDRLVNTFRTDYPKKRIGRGNPYYKCARCSVSDPEINGQLDGHRDSCSWANHQRNVSANVQALWRDDGSKFSRNEDGSYSMDNSMMANKYRYTFRRLMDTGKFSIYPPNQDDLAKLDRGTKNV